MEAGKKEQQSTGRSVSGLITKLHLAITPDFRIVEEFLTGDNKAYISYADELLANVLGCYVIEAKGYDRNKHRENLLLKLMCQSYREKTH